MNILTQDQARFRSEYIQNHPYYNLHIELMTGDTYKGNIISYFKLKKTHPDLFVDYQGQEIEQIQLNGHLVDLKNCQDNKIYLPHQNQRIDNLLTIQFKNKYSTSGHGLHSFMDGKDQYVYSQLEPHHASKMFPCFDQPNLKGRFSLKALLPYQWRVISNETVVQQNLLEQVQLYEVQFRTTDPISTYLYAILAGPYEQIFPRQDQLHRGISQSLFCRRSLFKELYKDSDHIFALTSKSMEYFEKMFQVNYPFSKYDQIFCPEYSTGAMENVGAVTINDQYIFKEKVTKSAFAARDNTIIHELSHMWFGNLVTMDWWDDLWLNESFAEFIAHQCQADHGEDSWVQFFERKLWGYDTDEKITTHPIYAEVKDTDQAENIFDGITYAKGAALLKQIYYMQDQSEFSKSMRDYFTKFAYSNATLKDFFSSMSTQSQIDWNKFKNEWIMTSGFNTVSAQVLNGKIIFKTEGSFQRQHNIKIGILFDDRVEEHKIQISNNTEVEIHNIRQDQAIILNYNDECYMKTSYTKQQLQKLLDNFHLVPGTLNKLVVFLAYFDQVNLGQICFREFFEFTHKYILDVKSEVEMKILLQWITIGLERLTPKRFQSEMQEKLANQLEKLYSQQDQDTFLLVRGHYVRLCRNQDRLNKLDIDQIGIKDGWQAVYNTFIYGEPNWELFSKLEKKDVDNNKHKRFLDSLLSRNQEQWNYFSNFNNEESVQMLSQAMRAFNHDHFDNSQYEDPYFDSLLKIFNNKNQEYAKAYFSWLYPKGERFTHYNQRLEEILKNTQNQFLIKLSKEAIDSNNRRSRAFNTY